jgi:PII-like signaling protein
MTTWKQLTIYVSEFDCWEHQPLHQVLLGMARRQRLTGVTVVRAISGYGKHGVFRTLNELDPSTESSALPLLVTVIDSETAIIEFFSLVKHMLKDKFVTCQTIEVLSTRV